MNQLKLDPANAQDKASLQFIDWSMAQINSKNDIYDFLAIIVAEIYKFYLSETPTHIKTKLKSKMIKGALEHGEPKINSLEIDRELKLEYLDLLGWYLMSKYLTVRRNSK